MEEIVLISTDTAGDYYLERADPGMYTSPCSKGLGSGCAGKIMSLTIQSDGLIFGKYEASANLYVWNETDFVTINLSD